MGLEMVEFFMDIEDEFDIRISDEDSQELTTCQKVAEYVITHVPASVLPTLIERSRNPQKRFYCLRNALMREFDLPRHAIHPKTPWVQILTGDIKAQWKRLGKIPEISNLPSLESDYAVLVFSSFFTVALFFALMVTTDLSFWIALCIILPLWCATLYFLTPEGDQIPESCQTVGDLVFNVRLNPTSSLSSNNAYQALPKNDEELLYAYTLRRVIEIAAEVMDYPAEKIRPDAHFIIDLGMA
ncbi:MAG: hypothetical protein ACRCWR_11070 [Saezia sp.]